MWHPLVDFVGNAHGGVAKVFVCVVCAVGDGVSLGVDDGKAFSCGCFDVGYCSVVVVAAEGSNDVGLVDVLALYFLLIDSW